MDTHNLRMYLQVCSFCLTLGLTHAALIARYMSPRNLHAQYAFECMFAHICHRAKLLVESADALIHVMISVTKYMGGHAEALERNHELESKLSDAKAQKETLQDEVASLHNRWAQDGLDHSMPSLKVAPYLSSNVSSDANRKACDGTLCINITGRQLLS